MSKDKLLEEVYQQLRKIACKILAKEAPGQTLQPTALVHEAYLKIQASSPELLNGTDHRGFLAYAGEAMRHIVVDQARRKKAKKRGKGWKRVPLDTAEFKLPKLSVDMEELSEALTALEAHDAAVAEVVKLKFFVGMTIVQIAEAFDQSVSKTNRQWSYAKAWLKDYLDSHQNTDTN
ncbi:MAG: ECF-type sigma factor [Gemmatales bacterium]